MWFTHHLTRWSYFSCPDIQGNNIAAVIIGVIVAVLVVVSILVVPIAIVTVIIFHRKKKTANLKVQCTKYDDESNNDSTTGNSKGYSNPISIEEQPSHLQTSAESVNRRFEMLSVREDCELREFIKSHRHHFVRGCAFYEFTHEVERINENQEIVLIRRREVRKLHKGEVELFCCRMDFYY